MPPSPSPPSMEPEPSWHPFVVALVGIICSIFLIVSYFKILQTHCLRFRARTLSQNQAQRLRLQDENMDNLSIESRALDSYVMHSLPITQFKKKHEPESRDGHAECAVCLEDFEEGQWLKHLPNCSHVFHVSCIDTWFQIHSSCPVCRSYVYRFSVQSENIVPSQNLPETLRREDYHRERSEHYQDLRSQILQNPSSTADTEIS